jgi:hypothetical protein
MMTNHQDTKTQKSGRLCLKNGLRPLAHLISFTPGFNQAARDDRVRSPTVREGISRSWPSLTLGLLTPIFPHISLTPANPGMNKTKWRTFEAKTSSPVYLCLRAFVVNVSFSSERINHV